MYYYISKSKEMSSSKIYHNTDVIEPFAKKKEDQIYFWLYRSSNLLRHYHLILAFSKATYLAFSAKATTNSAFSSYLLFIVLLIYFMVSSCFDNFIK